MNVQLLVYDLSNGFAKQMSLGLTGKQIDGIWHTAVVVFGKEYCFGQGVEVFNIGQSPYGYPVERINMGITEIPFQVFQEYMDHMRTVWTADKYHLLDNNCNSFSDEVCTFLVGKGIPKHITGLPAEFLATPLGKMVLPMIENMYGKSLHSVPHSIDTSHPSSMVRPCTLLKELESLLSTHSAVVVDFTSKQCPPCQMISPEFKNIIEEINETNLSVSNDFAPKILGLTVDVSIARDICSQFQIAVTPTFLFFHNGKKIMEQKGADRNALKSNIDSLVAIAFPPHKHAKLPLEHVIQMNESNPVCFSASSKISLIQTKLNSVLENANLGELLDTFAEICIFLVEKEKKLDPKKVIQAFQKCFKVVEPSDLFPVLDIFRLIVLQDEILESAMANVGILDLMAEFLMEFATTLVSRPVSDATKLMFHRLLCNLFKSKSCNVLVSSETFGGKTYREIITTLIVENLLSENRQLRKASSILAFNVLLTSNNIKAKKCMDVEWSLEIAAALTSAIDSETCQDSPDDETGISD